MDEPPRAQGQIWLAALPPPIHDRPVLILTRTSALRTMSNVTVATISSKARGVATEVSLSPETDGVARSCCVSLDNIFAIRADYLDHFISQLSSERMNEVFEAIHAAFELPY